MECPFDQYEHAVLVKKFSSKNATPSTWSLRKVSRFRTVARRSVAKTDWRGLQNEWMLMVSSKLAKLMVFAEVVRCFSTWFKPVTGFAGCGFRLYAANSRCCLNDNNRNWERKCSRYNDWRRGWDSNPRAGKTRPSDFESAPLWPLRYLSLAANKQRKHGHFTSFQLD